MLQRPSRNFVSCLVFSFLVCLRVCVNFKFLPGNLLNVSKFFTARTPKAAGLNFVSTSIRISDSSLAGVLTFTETLYSTSKNRF